MTDAEITAYVISANIKRRHLSASQKRDALKLFLQADPTKSNRSVAKTAGVPVAAEEISGD